MTTESARRDRILEIYREKESLDKELKRLMGELQKNCRHEQAIETDYLPSASGLFSAMPPMRICVWCSVEEEGWSSGYKKLEKSRVLKVVSRDDFYRYRILRPLQKIEMPVLD